MALLNEQASGGASSSAQAGARSEAITEERVLELLAARKAEEEAKAKKNTFKLGGFVKLNVMYSDFSGGSVAGTSAGRDFYLPNTIPVGSSGESYLDLNAKETRLNFTSTHNLDNGSKITTFVEIDFAASSQGNERFGNAYSPRGRHYYVTYDKWLFGQSWSTFQNIGALPESLDFIGPNESNVFVLQPVLRYTSGHWQFAVENPETTVTPFGGGASIATDDNLVPDLVGRYNLSGAWGDFAAAAIVRELRYEDKAAGIKDSTNGYGISLSGKFKIGAKDDFRWMATAGKGLGRYVGQNTPNCAVLDADKNLEAIDLISGFAGYRHFWNEKWRSNLTLGYLSVDNPVALTGLNTTATGASLHVNLIYSPVPKMDFGIEYLRANREEESGIDGDLNRVQFSAKYAF
ncbi:MAG: hypothetical protein KJZ57_00400 [Anaerolineales bacterium]|nr:hypothetical protein [Anaerolineales bacterium]